MNLDEIVSSARRARTDSSRVEIKSAGHGLPTKALWPTISAFSNTRGGLVILGLDESDDFRPSDGFDAKSVADALAETFAKTNGGVVTPAPHVEIDIVPFEDSSVVTVDVAELPAAQKPCFVTNQGKENGSYQRLSDGDHRLSTFQVFQLSTGVEQPRFDREVVSGTSPSDLDTDLVDRLLRRLAVSRPQVVAGTSRDEILRRIHVVDQDSGELTLAGLLSLGTFPQYWFPQLMISVAVFPTGDKAGELDGVRTSDRVDLEGPIPAMVDAAVARVIANLQTRRESGTHGGARDVPEIPVAALREAIANAAMHRDYSAFSRGTQTRVEVFPDRVDVISPGGLWGGRRTTDLWDGHSVSRNEVLSRLLVDVPLPGREETVSENLGTGIQRMAKAMRSQGLGAPKFFDHLDAFTARLDRHGLMSPDLVAWFRMIGADELPATAQHALAILNDGSDLTRTSLRKQLAIDSDEAESALAVLVRDGWLHYPSAPDLTFTAGERLSDQPALDVSLAPSRPEGLSTRDRVLSEFDRGEQLTVRDLSERTGISLPTLRRVLRQLTQESLIVPTAGPQDRRRAYRRGV